MLKKIFTSDQNLQSIQDNVDDALRPLQNSPLNQGVILVSSILLTSGKDNLVSHSLKRTPQFWILAGNTTNATVWNPASPELGNQSANGLYINLRCSSNCTVNVLF